MKKILCLSCTLFFFYRVIAQTGSIIIYDYPSRVLTPGTQVIPFDRSFTLLVTKFPNSNIKSVYLYEVIYGKGRRRIKRVIDSTNLGIDSAALFKVAANGISLKDQSKLAQYLSEHPNELDPDSYQAVNDHLINIRHLHKLEKSNKKNYREQADTSLKWTINKDSLSLYFMPIRPSKYFDIEVNTGLSSANELTVLELNKAILNKDENTWKSLYEGLIAHTKAIDYESRRPLANINFGGFTDYQQQFRQLGWDSLYSKLVDRSNDTSTVIPDTILLRNIASAMTQHGVFFDNIFHAIKIKKDTSLQDILRGLLPANYVASTSAADYFDFQARINNLDSSRAYFDSLANALMKLDGKTMVAGNAYAINAIRQIAVLLKNKEKTLKLNYSILINSIDSCTLFRQSYMFGNDNRVADLKTKSSFYITTDLGFTNIFANDYRNNRSYIPKLFFGLNIFFRQVDKNAPFNNIKWRWRERGLLSSRNPLQYLSFSLGLTIGGMSNSNFSNLYNSFSLTAGPSIRISKAFRFTGGMAFLDRTRANPLITSREFITGLFAAFSIDVDFLTPVQKITDALFKL